ncbi:Allantoate permease [Saitoella coloradoensis]
MEKSTIVEFGSSTSSHRPSREKVPTLKPVDAIAEGEVIILKENGDEARQFMGENFGEDGEEFDDEFMKKLVRKIDFTIVPLLALTYFLQFLDKTTLSYTSVMGLQTDTHLKGDEYSYLGMLFYVGFLIADSVISGTQNKKLKVYQMKEALVDVKTSSDAPDYIPGKTAIIVCLGAQVVVSFALRYVNIWYNKKKARVVEGMDPATREATRKHMAFADETDMRNPFFRYTN